MTLNKHAQSRAIILQSEGLIPQNGPRKAKKLAITNQDYAPVPPPMNLQVHPAGDCMIWLWRLNPDGYGIASFPEREQLAHRQAFIQSRGKTPKRSVLHLCHRPFCIQPSHLYDGSAKQNSEDRRIRTSDGLHIDLFIQRSETVQAVAKYIWPSPPTNSQDALLISPAEHDCKFIIPAGDSRICATCGRDDRSSDDTPYRGGVHQPANDDPNVAQIAKRSRSFRDIAPGLTIQMDGTTDYSIPRTRAERRRREKAARKSPHRDKPHLLGSTRVTFKPGETGHINMNLDFQAPGPGVILVVAQPIAYGIDDPAEPS